MKNVKRKRGQGDGTIRQKPNGLWEARYTIGKDVNGRQKQKSVYGKTEAEVVEKLNRLKSDVYTGKHIENKNIRLGEWLKDWIEIYKKHSVRPTTFECMMFYSKHIYAHDISCLRLVELKSIHFQKFYADKIKTLAPASVRKLHNILKSCLNQAEKNEMINYNPVKRAEPPAMQKPEIEILLPEEQKEFIKALEGEKLKPLFLLALQTGLRIGELLALKWDAIDFKNHTLTVNGTTKRVVEQFEKDYEGIKSRIVLQEPKTRNSVRTVPLMASAYENLILLNRRQKLKAIKDGKPFDRAKIVFSTASGSYIESKNVNRILYRVLEKAGLKRLSFHSMRHTFVSRMLEEGIDIKTISEIIGHSKTSFTLDTYAHILPSNKHDAVKKLDYLFDAKKA